MNADKLLITVAPCIPPYMAKDIPGLDLSPQGIADEVIRSYNAGANIVHLHVWDREGRPATGLEAFEETIRLIRAGCDIVIEGSTGGFNELTPAERAIALQAEIEMASLNPGSVNYDQGVYINSPSDILFWTSEMHRRRIKPDIAIFEAGMIHTSLLLAEDGWIGTPYLFTFVLGQQGALAATPKNLLFLTESVPSGSICFVARHSGCDINLTVMNMACGGHARAGFEDSPYYSSGEPARSNARLVERIVRMACELGREPATPQEARQLLGLK